MKIRTRVFIVFAIVAGGGFCGLTFWILDDLLPGYLQAMEESMVDTAMVLASFVEDQVRDGAIHTDTLCGAFEGARRKEFVARIYQLTKTRVTMRVYVTDRNGIVLFDSDEGRDEGKDYSRWNDVVRTLRGEYGARATRSNPDDPMTAVLHVAAPIKADGRIIGVLTVCKHTDSVALFLKEEREKIMVGGAIAAVVVVILGLIVALWVTRPIGLLTRYARLIRDGKRVAAPRLGRSEIGTLGAAFEEMRAALEGRQYAEEYVQTLTHQMKSPLSAIRGVAELLDEDMPPSQRALFLNNLRAESARIQDLIDRMLQLSAVENRRELRDVEEFQVSGLLADVIESMGPVFSGKGIQVSLLRPDPVAIRGERFLIRQALSSLLQNAADFSPPGGVVSVSTQERDSTVEISILDSGSGIPEYALDKVFDRFYSLRRPDTGKRSSGLGLAFVREVADLHGGRATLENRPEGGARATMILPVNPPGRTV